MKKPYRTPRLTVHGTVVQLTHMNAIGSKLNRVLGAGKVSPITLCVDS